VEIESQFVGCVCVCLYIYIYMKLYFIIIKCLIRVQDGDTDQ